MLICPVMNWCSDFILQHNNFKNNQQRVSTVKYLGELYTYRSVESRVILDTLWTLATFGHRKHPELFTMKYLSTDRCSLFTSVS